MFDDNALSSENNRVSDFTYSFQPTFSFTQTRPRVEWSLTYAPGYSIQQRLAERDVFANDLGFYVRYQPTRRSTLRLRTSFFITTDPFNRLDQNLVPEFGSLDRPNEAVVTPIARRLGGLASLDFTYQLGPRSVFGLGGTYFDQRFRDLPGPTPDGQGLIDTRVLGGRVFYARQFTQRNTLGFSYNFQNLTFRFGTSRTTVHGLLLVHSFSFTPHMTVSLFAGPEYSRTHDQVVASLIIFPFIVRFTVSTLNTLWSGLGGASYGWQGERTSFRLGAVRRISDGGGLLGPVRLHSASAEVRRQLRRTWTADLGVEYADTRALHIPETTGLRSLTGGVGFTHTLGENLTLRYGYARVEQTFRGTLLGLRDTRHNRATISLAYHFTRPLGH